MRPVLDFCAPAYHSLLNKTQILELELMQKRVMRIIYSNKDGPEIESLEERRTRLLDKFATKVVNSPIFGERWLNIKDRNNYGTRGEEFYEVTRPRTTRMQRNPLDNIRRLLNNVA